MANTQLVKRKPGRPRKEEQLALFEVPVATQSRKYKGKKRGRKPKPTTLWGYLKKYLGL